MKEENKFGDWTQQRNDDEYPKEALAGLVVC